MALSHALKGLLGRSEVKQNNTASVNTEISSTELAHINQEMYKKSAELAEKNKTLSLLQKINRLILGSLTHPDEIATQVTKLLVTETDFQFASVYLFEKEKKVLRRLARAYVRTTNDIHVDTNADVEIALSQTENTLVRSVVEKKITYASSLNDILIEKINNEINIKSVFISPLLVRKELIGAIVIGMREEQDAISDYRCLLLGQLSELIGIGIDNSLLYNEVQNTNQRLKELDLLKNEFVSVASHELRTPMTAIKSYLWMALEDKGGPLNEKQRYYIERGYNSVDRLIRLVNDMLNISRIESGRITIELQAVDLSKLAQEVVDEVLPRAKEVGVTVSIAPHDNLPPVLADLDKIKEVFFNLLGNSLKFTPQGGSVTVRFTEKDGVVETEIKDTGVGIEAEDIGKLFQKFGLLPGSYTTNQPAMGTGLGLYICRSIVELHQGKIWAASEGRGKGSTFTFQLKIFNKADLPQFNQSTSDKKESVNLIHSEI